MLGNENHCNVDIKPRIYPASKNAEQEEKNLDIDDRWVKKKASRKRRDAYAGTDNNSMYTKSPKSPICDG
jgi:hypothetical protein